MTLTPTRRQFLMISAGIGLALSSFAAGYVASIHLRSVLPETVREQRLLPPGDASPEARAGVLAALHTFQDGYINRDPQQLDAFMGTLFDRNADTLALGTEGASNEWARGYPAVEAFVQRDWQYWGDVRLDVDGADIWSSSDAAWVATGGVVHFGPSKRPVRFTAILSRDGDRWVFRQIQFQWDDSESSDGDVLRPRTYLRILQLGMP